MQRLFQESPVLKDIIDNSNTGRQAKKKLKIWALRVLSENPDAYSYFIQEKAGTSQLKKLRSRDYAAIRILDYIKHSGRQFKDLNLNGEIVESDPFAILIQCARKGTGGATPAYFYDMIHLFKQLSGHEDPLPHKLEILLWMDRYSSGLDPEVILQRKKNKLRILKIIIKKIDDKEIKTKKYRFKKGMSRQKKMALAKTWWKDHKFHLKFAVRTPEDLNEMLGFSLDREVMATMKQARKVGIPLFVNPYYLSLLDTQASPNSLGADLAIRQYMLYSKELVNEFGNINAWEKEDIVEPGKPNAAGWLIPDDCIHRRYPNVAILIPKGLGRACGGLCSICQRMYGFQYGNLNFNLEKLKTNVSLDDRLEASTTYFENDSQLRDVLITGGDALMSTNKTLRKILQSIYKMAKRKRRANMNRKDGEKYAQILRVRLGTRLPVYLPMRIQTGLVNILAEFKEKASKIGIQQFVFQTHFESPMEITPETKFCVERLNKAGWIVSNQLVFTSAASRRGHTTKLRKVLNDIGVILYYSFTVKGYMENNHLFTPNARLVQEGMEEKIIGLLPDTFIPGLRQLPINAENIVDNISQLRTCADIPFLASDRNVLNLPGVGKSLTFRTIGITNDGRRILEFDHDATREHSPIIKRIGKVTIIESKSIHDYLQQLDNMGEDILEYSSIYGYSLSETESRNQIFEYPAYNYDVTNKITNLDLHLT
ncbi:MAG: KamA family protein [Desulfobacula sp.]|uniref:KamA family radical SAM protein n=2 Tax=Desulfobacula sp. TaxID=2593537 RepID=UPI001D95FDA1|nr:KamA family protein [Desulfobacula sp.]MBT3483769.1 KamA family protein [Desulfobacula sp.]MBT3803453.1 KamA family protein [Desulfobacula sp.]MBT4023248.1 KamA family protein [Desulfobacula sp.]MBT4197234.1 KamA family protein [Desulfobacula sp.]